MNLKSHFSGLRLLAASSLILLTVSCSQDNRPDNDLVRVESYLDIAEVYKNQGQFRSAFIELQNALQILPDHAGALSLLAETNMAIGNYADAVDALSAALESDPQDAGNIQLLAEAEMMSGNPQAALERMAGFESDDPTVTTQTRWLEGTAHSMLGNQELARQAYQAALEADPNHIEALVGLSRVAYEEGNPGLAREYLDRAIATNPDHLDLWIWRGAYASLNGQYNEAETAFKEALEIMGSWDIITAKRFSVIQALLIPLQMQQKDDEALQYSQILEATPQGQLQNSYNSALALLQQGNLQEATASLNAALAVAPDHPGSNLLLGMTNYLQGNFVGAADVLAGFAPDVSASSEPIRMLAASHIQLGNNTTAIELLNQARERFPEDAAVVAMLGAVQQQNGNLEASILTFDEALALQPDAPEILFAKALSLFQTGDDSGAVTHLQQAVSAAPDYGLAKLALVDLYLRRGDADTARQQVEGWLQSEPESPLNINLAGRVALVEGRHAEARRFFNALLQADPTDLTARLMLARVAVAESDFQQAEADLNAALDREPTNAQALELLLALGIATDSESRFVNRVEEIAESYPGAVEPFLVLSEFESRRGNFEPATDYAEQAYARDNTRQSESFLVNALVQRTYYEISNQRPADAVPYIDRALELQETNLQALTAAAQLYGRLGDGTRASIYVSRIKSAYPASPAGFEAEGDMHIGLQNLPGAVSAYQQGWAIQETASIGAKLYRALAATGDMEGAGQFLNEWLTALPYDGNANLMTALTYQQESRDDQAIEHYEVAYRSMPNNLLVLNNLAWLYQQSNPPRALELASRAAELYPQSPDVLDTYGWILSQQGRREEALEVLRLAQSLAPESEEISQHIESLLQ